MFRAFRFDPVLYAKFKEAAGASGVMVTEAFEGFMRVRVEAGRVVLPEAEKDQSALETQARILLTWFKDKRYHYWIEGEKDYSTLGKLLQMLPQIENEDLRREIEQQLKQKV